MLYNVEHQGDLEIHQISLSQVEMVQAAKHIKAALYKRLSATGNVSDAVLALAMICKGIEESRKEIAVHDANANNGAGERSNNASAN